MAKWLITLDGDRFDLEDLPSAFPDGPVFAVREGVAVLLMGDSLDALDSTADVRAAAEEAACSFAAIMNLLGHDVRPAKVGTILMVQPDGRRLACITATASIGIRAKAAIAGGVASQGIGPLPRDLLRAARSSRHLHVAFLLWSGGQHTWTRLYRMLEEMESYLGRRADRAGLCSGVERERFRHTANTAEVAGADARHGLARFKAPENPMSHPEAVALIGRILLGALRRAQG